MKKIIFASVFWILSSITFAQTETKIPHDSLPPVLHDKLHDLFEKYHVSNIVKAVDKDGKITYKMEAHKEKVGNGTTTDYIQYLTYNPSGKLLSKKKDKQIFYSDSPKQKPKATKTNDGHNHQH
jgi:hypothetical protein